MQLAVSAQEDIDEHQPQPTRNTFLAVLHQFGVAALNLCALEKNTEVVSLMFSAIVLLS
jgi:uncharacterized membrane protein